MRFAISYEDAGIFGWPHNRHLWNDS